MSIGITKRAAQEIKHIFKQSEMPDTACFRLGIRGMSSEGVKYQLQIEDRPSKGDYVFKEHDVDVACDLESYIYLKGTTVDFNEETGFEINNPNIKEYKPKGEFPCDVRIF